jgi:hypothetical protein
VSKWLLLVYKIPREPTAGRVYVWRKMKQLGAIALQDAVWVLPATPRTQEQFQWIAAEIAEIGGEAVVWSADVLLESPTPALVARFTSEVEAEYEEILAAMKKKRPDLKALGQRYRATVARDYFQSALGRKVREKLLASRGDRTP